MIMCARRMTLLLVDWRAGMPNNIVADLLHLPAQRAPNMLNVCAVVRCEGVVCMHPVGESCSFSSVPTQGRVIGNPRPDLGSSPLVPLPRQARRVRKTHASFLVCRPQALHAKPLLFGQGGRRRCGENSICR